MKHTTGLLLGAYVAMIVGGATYSLTASNPPWVAASPPVLTWNIGTARPATDGTWAFVTSSPHVPQGFGTPTCNATTGVLTVPYLTALTTIVGSAVMTDEDWSREGIVAGASVGIDHTDIYFTKYTTTGPIPQSCSTINPVGNVWVQIEGTT